MNQKLPFRWLGLLLCGWLVGCATVPPVYDPIQDANFQGPTLAVARAQPDAFLQTRVRWGGTIARVENRRDETWGWKSSSSLWRITDGLPAPTPARAASLPGSPVFWTRFLDPAIYAAGRSITIVGPLAGTAPGQVGDYRTTYLVVTVERHRLWPERHPPEVIYMPDPFWYGPGYPWGYRWGPFW